MLWPKEFDNEKKFVRLENSPPPLLFLQILGFIFWTVFIFWIFIFDDVTMKTVSD